MNTIGNVLANEELLRASVATPLNGGSCTIELVEPHDDSPLMIFIGASREAIARNAAVDLHKTLWTLLKSSGVWMKPNMAAVRVTRVTDTQFNTAVFVHENGDVTFLPWS